MKQSKFESVVMAYKFAQTEFQTYLNDIVSGNVEIDPERSEALASVIKETESRVPLSALVQTRWCEVRDMLKREPTTRDLEAIRQNSLAFHDRLGLGSEFDSVGLNTHRAMLVRAANAELRALF